MSVSLEKLAQLSHGRLIGDGTVEVSACGLDSARLPAGALFAALPGTRVHGAQFVGDTQAGAVLTDAAGLDHLRQTNETRPIIVVDDIRAVLGPIAAEIYGHPTRDLTVLGITGTSGKTTTSYLLEAGLLHAGHSVGLIGTTGTRINRTPVPTSLTTPEAPRLQELFARMKDEGVTHVVMEVSSHALELGRVRGTNFAVAGFSNLSQDHLDFHPTMEEYFSAKSRLFLGEQASQRAVICVDDEWGERLHGLVADAGTPVTTVATRAGDATITAQQTATEPTGAQEVDLDLDGTDYSFRLPLPGEFNIANVALALGMATAVGEDPQAFLAGVENVAVPGRMERIDRGQDFVAVVDYAHKPAAIAEVLDTLRQQVEGTSGRVGVVVGAGGDRDSTKRPVMGAAAATRAELTVVTDDNPRTEDPAAIRTAVIQGARQAAPHGDIREIASRSRAIDELVNWAQPGDAIIVVGKGHEVGQLVGERTLHFDDREEMARAIEEKLAGMAYRDTLRGTKE
ncbi:UDP-N-acetylmuramoyl-L-alanyl-D-glutamate--2,6-diaminopimelate ligase [Corynebacterium macginleyi]|uniref:UDP-N-acetylmuramoyl-L-alanyl-D-glutamate--2,6-diaminopimelate ligase n=1 Tax=Corynebacterium macginleyi TaxID=38290 RepID=A0ABS1Y537_9CORY|nr:UDP-N-acetylmuramoyl-L-alanyl-D-glutamate--2,6-diaminopimelate ligase [Corynebacterium macginleyi]MBK4148272.1 UDP-N-acetylmuramoyl-L-alanyl-D-glutamate--2,6-diaminopimelate ligase [Corynebacterium macginleyi]MBK4150308.1 UDP-N-acetylmuramoyl-L-alanyl-D-glutamate--2,6-diaminopimelate ligase [Corynebacterium macginleyi]MBK4157643.1 UDP-N-acetylmuramoyl-L-alanyl-D-glutamate--2,6-diaminopimelate ligase [Corynebacterium macginleyi]MBK4160179.1 UDP-N-acetylmuramoyl-L-alanyl-D-glutamate--2,6-diami